MSRLLCMNKYKKRKGLTLIEVILSIAILALIIIPLLNMFTQSTIVNKKSNEILDATYEAQKIMEDLYKDSRTGEDKPITERYLEPENKIYWIDQTVNTVDDLVKVIIKVYIDENYSDLKSQMETIYLWKPEV